MAILGVLIYWNVYIIHRIEDKHESAERFEIYELGL